MKPLDFIRSIIQEIGAADGLDEGQVASLESTSLERARGGQPVRFAVREVREELIHNQAMASRRHGSPFSERGF